jgi:hypothetical protein
MLAAELRQPSALPSSPFTGAGNLRKSRFDAPTQSSGLSPFANRARMTYIPDLG